MRFLSICFIALATTSLWASRHGDLREHTQTASSIVLGEVTDSRSYYGSDGEIYSDVTVSVGAILKERSRKAGSQRTFTVKGGTVGDTHVMFTDIPTFETSESVLIFFNGDEAQEKYSVRGGWVAELNKRSSKVLEDVQEILNELDEPMVEGERIRADEFILNELAVNPSAPDGACYVLIGPKWVDSLATYKLNSTIPWDWQSSLDTAAATWTNAGTVFAFKSDVNSANELLIGPVPGASTLASTRIEYDSLMRIRRFTMTFNNAFSWTSFG